jgi:hypothetical protein
VTTQRYDASILDDAKLDLREAMQLARMLLKFGYRIEVDPSRVFAALVEHETELFAQQALAEPPPSAGEGGWVPGLVWLGAGLVAEAERGAHWASAHSRRSLAVLQSYRFERRHRKSRESLESGPTDSCS